MLRTQHTQGGSSAGSPAVTLVPPAMKVSITYPKSDSGGYLQVTTRPEKERSFVYVVSHKRYSSTISQKQRRKLEAEEALQIDSCLAVLQATYGHGYFVDSFELWVTSAQLEAIAKSLPFDRDAAVREAEAERDGFYRRNAHIFSKYQAMPASPEFLARTDRNSVELDTFYASDAAVRIGRQRDCFLTVLSMGDLKNMSQFQKKLAQIEAAFNESKSQANGTSGLYDIANQVAKNFIKANPELIPVDPIQLDRNLELQDASHFYLKYESALILMLKHFSAEMFAYAGTINPFVKKWLEWEQRAHDLGAFLFPIKLEVPRAVQTRHKKQPTQTVTLHPHESDTDEFESEAQGEQQPVVYEIDRPAVIQQTVTMVVQNPVRTPDPVPVGEVSMEQTLIQTMLRSAVMGMVSGQSSQLHVLQEKGQFNREEWLRQVTLLADELAAIGGRQVLPSARKDTLSDTSSGASDDDNQPVKASVILASAQSFFRPLEHSPKKIIDVSNQGQKAPGYS